MFDKWALGPLRLLNFAALGVLAIRFGPALLRRIPPLHGLETLGRASLAVFCAHVLAVLLVLALYGDSQLARSVWADVLLLVGVGAWLYGTARLALLWGVRRKVPAGPLVPGT